MKDDDKAQPRPAPESDPPASSPRRWRRLVHSLFIGIDLASAIAMLALIAGTVVSLLRSPSSMAMTTPLIVIGEIGVVLLGYAMIWAALRKPAVSDVFGAAGALAFFSFVGCALTVAETSKIIRETGTVPEVVGRLAVAWICLVTAMLTHLALRAVGSSPRLRSKGSLDDSDGDPSQARSSRSERVKHMGAGVIGAAAVVALAATTPTGINHRLEPLLRTTVAASSGHARFPSVAQIQAGAQQQSPPSEPAWETPLGTTAVKQLLAGSRGAIAVTDHGVYGVDPSTGRSTWCFATAALPPSPDTESSASLRGVDIYAGHEAFTSPDGAWLAYAVSITPTEANGHDSPEAVTRVIVLNTSTGRVSVDSQVVGTVPTVQLTDSNAIINRRVYNIADGEEIAPLESETNVVPGPGGHERILTRTSDYSESLTSNSVSVEGISPEDQHQTPIMQKAQTINGQPVSSGGWVVISDSNGEEAVQNIDTGRSISFGNQSKKVILMHVSSQAIAVWLADVSENGELADADPHRLYPLTLSVFDPRTEEVTAVDQSSIHQALFNHQESDQNITGRIGIGIVDTPTFSVTGDRSEDFREKLAVPTGEGEGTVTLKNGAKASWKKVSTPLLENRVRDTVLCPEGRVVSAEQQSDTGQVFLKGWRLPV